MKQLDTWHSQVNEEVIEPDRAIIDPHHHLWRVGTPYELDDLWADGTLTRKLLYELFSRISGGRISGQFSILIFSVKISREKK
mgnify:CR=1 FL=1